jgi:uncharacterized membrane protein
MKNSTLRVGESRTRTVTKTAVYRVLSTVAVYFLCLALGITSKGASTMAIAAFVLGIVMYYTHDRVWNMINWRRNEECKEGNLRSVTKTITYRIVVLVVSGVVARLLVVSSAGAAATFAIWNLVINMTLYYALERVANVIRRQQSHA